MLYRLLFIVTFLVLLSGMTCENPGPGPVPPPDPTGGTGGGQSETGGTGPVATGGTVSTGGQEPVDEISAFCEQLKKLGCPEGDNQEACTKQTKIIVDLPQADIDLQCVINAKTTDDAAKCKSVVCGGVR
jgi:hypothetical protein